MVLEVLWLVVFLGLGIPFAILLVRLGPFFDRLDKKWGLHGESGSPVMGSLGLVGIIMLYAAFFVFFGWIFFW